MSTTTTTRPRPGQRTETRPDPTRWEDEREVTTANAPRTFDYRCERRMPNTADGENESVPR
ncbi:hypothetical protein [Halosegnis marinus]|uniref:Uncharacterized protein n=2 Tax=Halosegnis marinus TaxID=3034023 RepID=A0ABD5ZN22_9EURY|nr:hypothetical protein [Halosegnis sp. DT85]